MVNNLFLNQKIQHHHNKKITLCKKQKYEFKPNI